MALTPLVAGCSSGSPTLDAETATCPEVLAAIDVPEGLISSPVEVFDAPTGTALSQSYAWSDEQEASDVDFLALFSSFPVQVRCFPSAGAGVLDPGGPYDDAPALDGVPEGWVAWQAQGGLEGDIRTELSTDVGNLRIAVSAGSEEALAVATDVAGQLDAALR